MVSNDEVTLSDPKNWPVEDEVHLLYSTLDNKPVGVDKHFQMSIIWSKFCLNSNKNVTSNVLWKKLGSWYNLKSLDEFEAVPVDRTDEDFVLPAEIVPEFVMKNLTEEDKKYIDFSGSLKKFISACEIDDDDADKSQFKLKGSDRMKWFECPQVYKSNDCLSKRSCEGKSKLDANDSLLNDSTETKKVIRQYGKAGEVSSGSFLTLNVSPSIYDESDENTMEVHTPKEETADLKRNAPSTDTKNDQDKSSKAKRRKLKAEIPTPGDLEACENSIPLKNLVRSTKAAEHVTRARKASSTSQDVSSGTESDKNVPPSSGEENAKSLKRRFSQRVSSSDPRAETPTRTTEGSNKSDPKRKTASRR